MSDPGFNFPRQLPYDLRNYRARRPWYSGLADIAAMFAAAAAGYLAVLAVLSLA